MADSYTYDGMEAELYDRLDELSDFEDLAFYQWFVDTQEGPVLDLGCGTGRVLLPLVESGREVVGLDSSPAMLDLCAGRLSEAGLTAELVGGDMRDFDLGGRLFSTILVPGFSIQLLLDDEDLAACLRCCRRHLAEGGQLILPTNLPWEMIWDGRTECPLVERKAVEDGSQGERLVAWQGWSIDSVQQRLLLRNRIERCMQDGRVLQSEDKEMSIRWHLPHEMLQRLGSAGFTDVSVYGDFDFEPPDAESDSVIYLARG